MKRSPLLHGALVALMAMAAMGSAAAADVERTPVVHPPSAAAAPIDSTAVKPPASVDAHDLESGRKQHAAMSEKKQELEQLRAEVNRLRAVSEMCQAGIDKRVAAAAVAPSRSP